MPADPYGAALIGPMPDRLASSGCIACEGRYGARCERTATGPTPGPPPPCGMQNVLCRFRCDTSAPNRPGRAYPTSAFRFAPSTYTWPPASCTFAHRSAIDFSYTPCVDGYVTMIAARLAACAAIFASRSAMSTLPASSQATTTTRMPAMTALAALVPCALDGIRHT